MDFRPLTKGDKFHFIAIGGIGQSALAKILLQRGYEVTGSDINDSKYLNELRELGAKIFIGHSAKNLQEGVRVVVSSAIKASNPELKKAQRLGLDILHRSDLLNIISKDFPLFLGFSGTHGKTTTSGLASYILTKIKANPAFAVGGIIPEIHTNANADKKSQIFTAELDESDGSISKYSPKILVVNNLEADHLDFYKNGLEDILKTFNTLVDKIQDGAKILLNVDDSGVKKVVYGRKPDNLITYSVERPDEPPFANKDIPAYFATDVKFTEKGASFSLVKIEKDVTVKKMGLVETSLKGLHNVYNTLAVVSSLIEAGYEFNEFKDEIKGFSGMGRRFETVMNSEKFEIIDDYAHHPSEIKATLKALKNYKEKAKRNRTVAIFQPHRYTRLKGLWGEFLNSFDEVDKLIVTDVFSAGDKADEKFNSKNFAEEFNIKNKGKCEYIEGGVDEIGPLVKKMIKEGDVIITLGAGDITKLGGILKGIL